MSNTTLLFRTTAAILITYVFSNTSGVNPAIVMAALLTVLTLHERRYGSLASLTMALVFLSAVSLASYSPPLTTANISRFAWPDASTPSNVQTAIKAYAYLFAAPFYFFTGIAPEPILLWLGSRRSAAWRIILPLGIAVIFALCCRDLITKASRDVFATIRRRGLQVGNPYGIIRHLKYWTVPLAVCTLLIATDFIEVHRRLRLHLAQIRSLQPDLPTGTSACITFCFVLLASLMIYANVLTPNAHLHIQSVLRQVLYGK